MSCNKIRHARNGCAVKIYFNEIPVYHTNFGNESFSILGRKLNKKQWINNNINDLSNAESVEDLLSNWTLFKNGWLVNGENNLHLFYYLCQIGNCSRPKDLDYITPIGSTLKIIDL